LSTIESIIFTTHKSTASTKWNKK